MSSSWYVFVSLDFEAGLVAVMGQRPDRDMARCICVREGCSDGDRMNMELCTASRALALSCANSHRAPSSIHPARGI
jgi:hypothetical protein